MTHEASSALIKAPGAGLTVASKLAERTLAARASRAGIEFAPAEVFVAGGRTFIVGSRDPGAYPTINAALAVARDGDQILVRPGSYAHGFLLERDVEIRRDGGGEAIVHVVPDEPIRVTASRGHVIGLTIHDADWVRVNGLRPGEGSDDPRPIVIVEAGSTTFERVTFETSRSGLMVTGPGTAPQFFGCEHLGFRSPVTVVCGGATPTFRDCRILMGLEVRDSGTGGHWEGGWIDTVLVSAALADPSFEDVDFEGYSGLVTFRDHAEGLLRGCRIRAQYGSPVGAAIVIEGHARPRLVGNEIALENWRRHSPAIKVQGASTSPLLRANVVEFSPPRPADERSALWVLAGAAPRLASNRLGGRVIAFGDATLVLDDGDGLGGVEPELRDRAHLVRSHVAFPDVRQDD